MNDPEQNIEGTMITMVVNECNVATKIDEDQGIKSYGSDFCADKDKSLKMVESFGVAQKLMSQSFSPWNYT